VGLHRLLKQGHFTECQETDELMLGYKRQNNPVLCFVDDMCHIGQEHQESKKELYTKYREYCNAGGYKILSRENFFRELYTAVNNLHMIRPRVDGRREQYLKGIAINGLANEE
jgi:putative DNA primase/helicase